MWSHTPFFYPRYPRLYPPTIRSTGDTGDEFSVCEIKAGVCRTFRSFGNASTRSSTCTVRMPMQDRSEEFLDPHRRLPTHLLPLLGDPFAFGEGATVPGPIGQIPEGLPHCLHLPVRRGISHIVKPVTPWVVFV